MPCRILSLVPYRVLPPATGGQWSIVSLHDAIGRLCQNHLLGVVSNAPANGLGFMFHPVFAAGPGRYLPRAGFAKALSIARRYDVTHIICEHPYMAPLAAALSRKLHIPWALRSQNIESARFKTLGKAWWPAMRLFERWAMRAADAVFFITPEDCSMAIEAYGLDTGRCYLAPFGTPLKVPPGGHSEAKATLAQQLGLDASLPWLYFLGVQSYAPNAEAVNHIIAEVLPRLQRSGTRHEILVGGKGLSPELTAAIEKTAGAVRYLGFIEELDIFLKACDIMLNPLTSGGGIKTKAIEALAYNKIVVSTVNGAAGILPEVCGVNLIITPDGDWDAFTAAIAAALTREPRIPAAFYDRYNWDAVAEHVTDVLCAL